MKLRLGCVLDHRCVSCGLVVLKRFDHEPRGFISSRLQFKCREYFNVRCEQCRSLNAPLPTGFKLHSEMTEEEHRTGVSIDGRKFVFEVM